MRGGPGDVRGNTTLGTDCVPLGIPQTFVTPYPFQIIQTPKFLLMIFEYPNTFRYIWTDGRPHPVDPDPTWMGDATGRWDGDTLVVDNVGFNDKTEVSGYMHTEALHVVERYRRVATGLQYDVTVEDPNVFAGPVDAAHEDSPGPPGPRKSRRIRVRKQSGLREVLREKIARAHPQRSVNGFSTCRGPAA